MGQHRHARVVFTPKVAREICRRIAGGQSLLRICGPRRAPGMPDRITVHAYLRKDEAFRRAYLLARDFQAACLLEEMVQIADGRDLEPGRAASLARDRAKIAARKWLVGVMAPRGYGR